MPTAANDNVFAHTQYTSQNTRYLVLRRKHYFSQRGAKRVFVRSRGDVQQYYGFPSMTILAHIPYDTDHRNEATERQVSIAVALDFVFIEFI